MTARAFCLPWTRISLNAGLQARLDLLEQSDAGVDIDGSVWEERNALSAAQSDLGGWLAVPIALASCSTFSGRRPSWATQAATRAATRPGA